MNTSEYLNADEACQMLGVKRSTLYGYVSNGILDSYKRGVRRETLYKKDEVEALLTIRPATRKSAMSVIPSTAHSNALPVG